MLRALDGDGENNFCLAGERRCVLYLKRPLLNDVSRKLVNDAALSFTRLALCQVIRPKPPILASAEEQDALVILPAKDACSGSQLRGGFHAWSHLDARHGGRRSRIPPMKGLRHRGECIPNNCQARKCHHNSLHYIYVAVPSVTTS